jgi:pyruvate dehydrogenase E2 component (dihydrolipoamide acetyltransferase)
MPRLSDSMEEGTVGQWLVEVGAPVSKGQPLVEIETDKATAVYEAEADGILLEILVPEGGTAALGTPIARIGDGSARTAAPSAAAAPSEATPAAASGIVTGAQAARARPARTDGVNASPVARRLAAELGVDLAGVQGTGPGGIVTKTDVERATAGGAATAAPTAPAAAGGDRVQRLTRVQQTIARRMVEGASAPTFSVEVDVDLTDAVALRASLKEANGTAPSVNDIVVKAVALALREFPRLNGSYGDEGFLLHERIDLGVAVATDDALIVPVVRRADTKALAELAAETRALAEKVRDGTIAPNDVDGGTFTVTNLGMLGARSFVPILNPPQAAILSVGAVQPRAVVDELGGLIVKQIATLTLVCDHRIVYGAEAAKFLSRLGELLQTPAQL